MPGSLGTDSNWVEIDSGTSQRCQSRPPGTQGTAEGESSGEQSDDPERLYSDTLHTYHCAGGEAVLRFVQEADERALSMRAVQSGRDPYSRAMGQLHMGGLARVYGPGAVGLLPITGMVGDAVSGLMEGIMKAAEAFFRGLGAGLAAELKSEHFARLGEKLGDSAVLSAVFPVVFSSGAVVGVLRDVVDSVKGAIDLIGNVREIADALFDLIERMLKDPEVAYDLGKQVGTQAAEKIKNMLGKNVVEFTFELGMLVGPMIIYSLLAFFGVPLGAVVGARVTAWFGKLVIKFPKLATAVNRISRLIPDVTGFVRYGRATKAYIRQAGMPPGHFNAFKKAAKDNNVIAIVRNTNEKSMKWIEKGFPPKGMDIKIKTSKRTGIVTARNKADFDAATGKGYYVVDDAGVARNARGDALDLGKTQWKPEKGQVIDPKARKPLVGDYDLMGVIDPESPGRNLSLVVNNKELVADVSSPIVDRFKRAVNAHPDLDRPRVLHGAQDQFGGFDGGATVFYPDGHATYLPDGGAVEAFYNSPSILRQTRKGKYPAGPHPEWDEHGRAGNVELFHKDQ